MESQTCNQKITTTEEDFYAYNSDKKNLIEIISSTLMRRLAEKKLRLNL